ncbi:MAG: Appr-1-p processing protein [Gammaproteobacteria bacterium]|nr:MAG: Appr-1-p processing protein [Gammaproteobacteria bacterium]
MIHETSGDILLSKAQVIAHGIAPNDPFNQGLALALRERWPAMAKDFRHYCHTQHPESGGAWSWMGSDGRIIVNLLTQEGSYDHGGKPGVAHTEFVNKSLKALRQLAEKEKFTSIALPKLATGVGRLDWAEVKPLIEKHLGDLGIPVIVYTTYHAGEAANEKL